MQLCKVLIAVCLLLFYTSVPLAGSSGEQDKMKASLTDKQKIQSNQQSQKALKEAEIGKKQAYKEMDSYMRKVYEAADNRVFLGHTGYDDWFDLLGKRKRVASNAKQHNLASKILKKQSPILAQILHGRSNELKHAQNHLQNQMDTIKANNKYDNHLSEIRHQAHLERWQKYFHAMDNYREIIRKHSQ